MWTTGVPGFWHTAILRTHQKSMEWHQEAMAQLIEDFFRKQIFWKGTSPKKWRDWMYGFIRFYMGLCGFIWCTMMLYGLKKNNEIGMSEWDILPPGNDMWREPLRTKWGFNVNRKNHQSKWGDCPASHVWPERWLSSGWPELRGCFCHIEKWPACLMFSNFFSQQVSGFFLPNDSCHLASKIVMARNGREK